MEVLEDRTLLAVELHLDVNFYEDNGGTMGALLSETNSNVELTLGDSYFVEIVVADIRDVGSAAGVIALGVDISWNPAKLEEIDSPFDPTDPNSPLVTSNFDQFRGGTLDNTAGTIDELGGGTFTFAGGVPIGIGVFEQFSLMRFTAEETTTVMEAFTVVVGSSDYALADNERVTDVNTGFVFEPQTFTITSGNTAPTVALNNTVTSLPEDTDTTSRVKVADIVVTDDGVGTNVLSLTGADAALFEIDGTELFLKAGTALDFESDNQLDVTVNVDDASVGTTPDDSASLSIGVTDVNEPPTVALNNTTTSLPEDTDTSSRIKVADIVVTDDALGTNDLSLTGADAALFEIDGTELFLKAGTVLDLTGNPILDVTVNVDDTAVGTTPDDSASLAVTITDVNTPPTVILNNQTTSLPEDTNTTSRVKVADIVVNDDGTGTNVLSLTGADAALFEIDGTELFLKAGTVLDFESDNQLDVTVNVDDAAVGTTPDDSASLSIGVTDVNEPPTVALNNTTTSLPEDTNTTSRIKVADIVVTDDALGTNDLSLTGADAALFEIDGTELFLKAGTVIDLNGNPVLDVTVNVDDSAVGTNPDDSASLAVTITDVNTPPTVVLNNQTTSLPEDTDTTSRVKVADIVVNDDGTGTNVLSLTGADAALFEIDGNELFLKAGTVLDFETDNQLDVTVNVDDAAVGTTPDDSASLSIGVTDVNEPPTVALQNTVTSLPENTNTSSRVKVADIVITDDALGTNDLSLTGADAALFEIDGTELFLKAGTVLDLTGNPILDVTVNVDDSAIGTTPDDSAALSVTITDVNDPPTVALNNTTTSLSEDTDTTSRVKVADIVITDDALGTNVLSLTGADAALFEIDGNELFLKAGTVLDFETDNQLDVTVNVDDALVGTTPDDSASLSIGVTDANEPPTVSLDNVTTNLLEDANTTSRIKVADIVVTDDALGSNVLSLSGADAALFEIDGTELFLKAGTALDFETDNQLDVTVDVNDAAVGTTPDDSASLSISISDVNEPPTVALNNTVTSLPENTNTSSRVKVADIIVTDDALGTNDLSLTGADAALFEIDGTELFLKAGTVIDLTGNPVLDVTVNVDDSAVGTTPDDSAALSITITEVNDPPTVALNNTVTSLPEDADTSSRVKVADIVITDDPLGTNVLSLSGADAALFEIDGTELFLKMGTVLDFETDNQLDVTVNVDDATVGTTPDDSAALSIGVTDVNEPPTVALNNTVTGLPEDADTSTRIKVADIVVTDDALGTNDLSLTGADAALFEIDGTELFLKAGTVIDLNGNPVLDVTVNVDDTVVGTTPDDSASLAITIADVNDPPMVALNNTTTSLPEDTDTTSRVKVADIVVTDDALGTNDLSLSGADAALFEIDGTELFIKAGVVLDFETNDQLDVTVNVDDTAVGTTPDDSASLAITVTDVNEPPTVDDAVLPVLEGQTIDIDLRPLANDFETDPNNLIYSVFNPTNGNVQLLGDGFTARFTPPADFNGAATFQFSVEDAGMLNSDNGTITLEYLPVNDEPSFNVGGDQNVDEDSGTHMVANFATNISAGPANESGQDLTFLITTNNDDLFAVGPAIDPTTGTLTYTLADDAVGTAIVSVQLMDDGGTDNGGDDLTGVQTFEITVNPLNDAPEFDQIPDQAVQIDSGEQSISITNVGPGGGADEAGQTVMLTAVSSDTSIVDNVVVEGTGSTRTLKFTPVAGAEGTVTITVTAVDDGGTPDQDTFEQTFTIEVAEQNTKPDADIAGPFTLFMDEGGVIRLDASGSTDAEQASDTLIYEWDFDNDGQFDDAVGSRPFFSAADFDGRTSALVRVKVTDAGGFYDGDKAYIIIQNAAPVLNITGDTNGVVGQMRRITLNPMDPSTADQNAQFKYEIDWGDGRPVRTVFGPAGMTYGNIYHATGTYSVKVTATDKDNGTSTVTMHQITIGTLEMQGNDLAVSGTDGNDVFKLKKKSGPNQVEVIRNGQSLGTYTVTGRIQAFGLKGNDTFFGTNGFNILWDGAEGNDVSYTHDGDDIIYGKGGKDTIITYGGNNFVNAGDGNNVIRTDTGDDHIVAGGGADNVRDAGGNNVIHVGHGNNYVFTDTGNDIITTGSGNDRIISRGGNNWIETGNGINTVTTQNGNDTIYGGAHRDVIVDYGGHNMIMTFAGNDYIDTNTTGNNLIDSGADADYVHASLGNDLVRGGTGNDTILGFGGNDILLGEEGNDKIFGELGSDILIGGIGADDLFGDGGEDILIGGRTDHDDNDAALRAILNEWISGGSYNARVDNIINGGGLNGAFTLNGTVIDDGHTDDLFGGSATDLFYSSLVTDNRPDINSAEVNH